jgi:5-methylcytosine-specific restriction endonuclease McrA
VIDYSGFALSKPPKKRKSKPSHAIYRPDGTIERIVLSPTDWRKLRDFVWDAEMRIHGFVRCHLCASFIWTFHDMELDHKIPRGHGGGSRDDRFVAPSHRICNRERGSKRI